jgi:hypothetical protein
MNRLMGLHAVKVNQDKYGGLHFKPASLIPAKRIKWYWPNMLAEGKFHVFAGDAGIGKTQINCNVAATISKGGIFPGEKEPCEQGKVLYLSGEDGASDTIIPRLKACDAVLDNITLLDSSMKDGSLVSLSRNLGDITDMINDDGNYKLFIIDPVTAFCDDKFDNNSVTSVRSLATKLGALAEDTGVAVIGLTHLTKDEQRKAVNRILGSGAWVHASRVVLGAAVVDGQYYFGKWKANIADCKPVYPYQMCSKTVEDLGYVHHIEFDRYPLLDKALDEFQSVSTGRGATGDIAQDVLVDEMQDGYWHRKADLVQVVQRVVQISERQIERIAFSQLHIESEMTPTSPPQAKWRIPKSDITVHT